MPEDMLEPMLVQGRIRELSRFSTSDLEIVGLYLFGPRWSTPLARALNVSRRLVCYWKAGSRPVSVQHTSTIAAMVRAKHGERMRREWVGYQKMIASLSDTETKARLQLMDLTELLNQRH
jgi:hypothetical protein